MPSRLHARFRRLAFAATLFVVGTVTILQGPVSADPRPKTTPRRGAAAPWITAGIARLEGVLSFKTANPEPTKRKKSRRIRRRWIPEIRTPVNHDSQAAPGMGSQLPPCLAGRAMCDAVQVFVTRPLLGLLVAHLSLNRAEVIGERMIRPP